MPVVACVGNRGIGAQSSEGNNKYGRKSSTPRKIVYGRGVGRRIIRIRIMGRTQILSTAN